MDKRSVPIALLSGILLVAALLCYLLPEPTEAVPTRVLLENSGGRVIFSHKAHTDTYGTADCATCHHDLIVARTTKSGTPDQPVKCSACHGATSDPNFVVAHQETYRAQGGEASCVTCHHLRTEGLAATWDHEMHKEYAGEDCTTCHHPAQFEIRPGKTVVHKPQKCSNCHTARANPMTATPRKDAAHTKCRQACHESLFEDKLAGCKSCHSFANTSEDLATDKNKTYDSCASCHGTLLGQMDAFHGSCMGCHDTMQKGPGAKAACVTCHRQ